MQAALRIDSTNSAEWLTVKQVSELTNYSVRYVRDCINSNKFTAKQELGNGGLQYRILLDSLPAEAQAKYREIQAPATSAIVRLNKSDAVTDGLNDRQRQIALAKADFLSAYIKSFEGLSHREILTAKNNFIFAFNTGHLLPETFAVLGKVNRSTVDTHWLPKFQQSKDYGTLAPQYGYKAVREAHLSEQEALVFADLLFKPEKIRIGYATRLTKYFLKEKGVES